MQHSHDEAFDALLRQVAETPHVPQASAHIGPGIRLAGRFEIVEKLGEGGMGQVFAAVDHGRGARVAVKVLGRFTPQSIAQIKGEFRAAAEIVNPNLVRLHELVSDGDLWFFAMDLVEGVTLPELLQRQPEKKREPGFLVTIFRQLALALSALHDARTLHLDIKPSNFLIAQPDHRVVLLDFGLARPPDTNRRTELAGTFVYMAPEQVLGEPLTEAADWYAFGVVLYEVLTGELPLGRPLPGRLADAPPELAALCLRLLELEPARRLQADEVLRALGVQPKEPSTARPLESSALIGRQSELATLEAAIAQTLAGQPAMVLVEGPSGIGKSALVEHFIRAARARGSLVLTGRCRERESMGYKAVDGLIDSIVALLDELPAHEALTLLPANIADLTILFPALRAARVVARMPNKKAGTPDRAVARRQAIVAFHTLITRLRRRAPLVIWIDDLQWSDRESAFLLGPLLGGTAPVPLLFVGSTRSGSSGGPLVDALSTDRALRLPASNLLPLGPLSSAQAEHLALQLLPVNDRATRDVARKIGRESGGHPLFIAELVHNARFLPRVAGARVPSTLVDLVSKRVAMLPQPARSFLELTALAAVPLPRNVLRQNQGLGPADAERIIDLLRANRLARSQGLTDDDSIDIHHDRIREIIIQDLTSDQLQQRHLSLARTLEGRDGINPELVATHYESANELASAGRYWILAADQAMRSLAFGHAAELYDKGLDHAGLADDRAREVKVRRAEALVYAGKGADAADVYLATAVLCPQDQAIELRRRAAEQLLLSGHLARGLGVIEEVLRAIELPPTRSGRKALVSLAARRTYLRARGLRHRERSEDNLSREELARLDASWTIACSLGALDFMRGAEFQAKHLLLALRAGEPRRLLRALTLEAAYAATPGPGSERRSTNLLAVADRIAQKNQDDAAISLLCLTRGVAAYLQGRLYDSLKHCEEAIYILTRRSVGAVWEMVTARRFVIASLFFLGRMRKLAEFVPPLLAEAESNGNLYATMCFRTAYSTVSWLAIDAVGEARRQLDRARTEWKADGFQLSHCNLLIGESFLDLYAGDAEKAITRFEEQWPLILGAQLHRISVLRVQLRQLRAASALVAANALEARGHNRARVRELRRQARRAAHLLRDDPVRRAAPLADLIEAAVERADGNRPRARQLLERSIHAFEEQGMALFSAAARVRLGHLMDDQPGQLLAETGIAELRHEGVTHPGRMVNLLSPGFVES